MNRALFAIIVLVVFFPRQSWAVLDKEFFQGSAPVLTNGASEAPEQGPPVAPSSLSYSFDLSTTRQLSHSWGASFGVSPSVSLISDATYSKAPNQAALLSGDIGAQAQLSDLFSTRVQISASQSGETSATMGGTASLDTTLSALWSAERRTRLSVSLGLSQTFESLGVTDGFGLDTHIYEHTATVGLSQEFAPGTELGFSYSWFGSNQGGTGRDTIGMTLSSQLSPQVAGSFSVSSVSLSSLERSLTLGTSFTYTFPSQKWSIGTHGGLFQQITPKIVGEGTLANEWSLGYSGGFDLGLYW